MNALFSKIGKWTSNYKVIFVVFVVLAIFASFQQYFSPLKPMNFGDNLYTEYNNYVIFKYSFFHLINFKDLYCAYPDSCGDLYKYSPTFSLLFAPFAILPDYLGLILFNILNALVLFFAIKSLPGFEEKKKVYMLFFVLMEMMTSIQNCQTNSIIAGLLILAFIFLEKDKILLGTFFIVLTIFIKLFGIVAFVLFLFSRRKIKFIACSALWTVILSLLPLLIISLNQLIILYKSWLHLISIDQTTYLSISIMGCIKSWFGIDIQANIIVLIGAVLFMVPFIRNKNYHFYEFRIAILASILIWIVIFNHMAESPSYVISMSGMAIWFFRRDMNFGIIVLLCISLTLTSLCTTDIFPWIIRDRYFYPYIVKAVPSIFVWFWIFYQLTFTPKLALSKNQD